MKVIVPSNHRPRRGITVLDMIAALSVLLAILAIVAPLAVSTLSSRTHAEERLHALILAENELEAAKALSNKDRTAAWAAGRQLPADFRERFPQARLKVSIQPEPNTPNLQRVTVQIRWEPYEDGPARQRPLELFLLCGGTP
ncbi:MAG: type IV pilus modification PilV family protein [Gemmataceae bacterium]